MSNKYETSQSKEHGLKHGQFKVKMRTIDNEYEEVVVDPLTQDEYAEGWNLVLPRETKKSTTHHFSVYLSQLPPHLWHTVRTEYTEDGNEQYATIFDNIYHYTVKQAKSDKDVFKLYKLVSQPYPDLNNVEKLYKSLEQQRVKGWLMTRAKYLLNP
jgi:hypothetical protein